MSFTMVYYHIPEDFDDPEQPNAFGIGKPIEDIKLSDIKRLFPVEGTYIFRFKHISGKSTLWMDLKDDDSKAIAFQNRIVMKVSRINWDPPSSHSHAHSSQSSQNSHSSHVSFSSQKPPITVSPPKPTTFNLFEFEPSPQKKVDSFDMLFPH
ncbi:hypothetical protein SteCoe_10188 [Stentor coeruleus]|uniref:DIX domain-containing protein n=1 Tax=Stentor coeruleus TaxID=5963 RepID=A0A1R2CG23_9CILI|nr:hypothetical protein SteCoe_10188 [Stentor coeruleus]